MARRLQSWRLFWLALVLCLAFAGLGYRLVDLQAIRHDELSAKSQQYTQREFLLDPRRGDILDSKGNLLATSVPVKTICADPSLIGNRQTDVAHLLAPLLQQNESWLGQRLLPTVRLTKEGRTVTNQFVVLKRKVPMDTWDRIKTAMSQISFVPDEKRLPKSQQQFYRNLRDKAISAQDDELRTYPNQSLAAHVLGYTTTEERQVDDNEVNEIVGRDGIEWSFNSKLTGVRGWRLTETDHRQREMVAMRQQDVQPHDGLNVVLTIDSYIQHIVEAALAEGMAKVKPLSISGVVMRPRTGEILALANLPTFDPNQPGDSHEENRRDRVITDVAEPGSTFKIVVVSGALNDHIVQLTDTFDCEHGHFFFAGRHLHDHEPYGVLSVENIIMKSSNIGAAKVGIKLGQNRLYDYIEGFGFGVATGIPLPGELSAHQFVRPVEKWSKVSIAQIPMGQGIAVTRLQMMLAMCAIANDGWLMRPMLVDRLEDRDHRIIAKYGPQRVRQVITPETAKLMVKALKTVVSSEGTAPKAALEHYTVAGKTGTAQKVEHGEYVHDKFFASFIGFFPADNPELCISVMMDEPDIHKGYYGGQTAAPVFKEIAERAATYLNIRPDDAPPPSLTQPAGTPADARASKPAQEAHTAISDPLAATDDHSLKTASAKSP